MINDLTKVSIKSDRLAPADATIPVRQKGFIC
jgi:hypothetical protein